VSVVIPAYNAEKTIRNAIDSVLEQTVSDLELIVVDDASTDGTVRAVEAVHDPRVRLFRSPRNSGPSAARNTGVKLAKGRWVAFLDADDEWVPDRLGHLVGVDLDQTDCFVADWIAPCLPGADGRLAPLKLPTLPAHPLAEKFGLTEFLKWKMCAFPIVPRAALGRHGIEFPEWGSGGEWAFLIARLSAGGMTGKLLPRVGYLYRVTGAHRSSTLGSTEEQLKMAEFLATDGDVPEAAKEALRKQALGIRKRLVLAALRERKWGEFAYYARQHPGDLAWLPTTVVRFLGRQIRYLAASRSTRAVR
jgi:glycosyltransferase involved in cell wall biosynthesis